MVKNSKKNYKVLPKDDIFQISEQNSLLSIGQVVCWEILNNFYT